MIDLFLSFSCVCTSLDAVVPVVRYPRVYLFLSDLGLVAVLSVLSKSCCLGTAREDHAYGG